MSETSAMATSNSLWGHIQQQVRLRSGKVAAQYKKNGRWQQKTWKEVSDESEDIAMGILTLGLEVGDRVNIISNTRYEWIITDLAIVASGGVTVPIYPTNVAKEAFYITEHSGAGIIFVENDEQLKKVLDLEKQFRKFIKKVVIYDGKASDDGWIISLADLIALGQEQKEKNLRDLRKREMDLSPATLYKIIYTSGTTGPPKGVVYTHDHMMYEGQIIEELGLLEPEFCQFLFLPLAHSFACAIENVWMKNGHRLAIAESMETIVDNLKEVQPHFMASVPRVFEKIYAKIVSQGLAAPGLKGKLFAWALKTNDMYAEFMINNKPVPITIQLQMAVAKKLVFSKIALKLKEILGPNMMYMVSGGAPLAKKMAYFLAHAGLNILEGYGLTETSAGTTLARPSTNKIGTVGEPLKGVEIKINPDGEILIRSRGVMKCYWKNPEATSEIIDKEGWFYSGDIGKFDSEGRLMITDRKKDIIITAGGKNVAPQNIENLIKTNPLISQVMVYGDKKKFLSALITLNEENARTLAQNQSISYKDYRELTQHPKLYKNVEEAITQFNTELNQYETIKKFAILDHDFSIGEELTPTLKVKRKLCTEKYKNILDSLYAEEYN